VVQPSNLPLPRFMDSYRHQYRRRHHHVLEIEPHHDRHHPTDPPICQEDAEAIGQHRQCALRQELKRRQREASQYIITSARLITPVLVRQGPSHFNMIHYLVPRTLHHYTPYPAVHDPQSAAHHVPDPHNRTRITRRRDTSTSSTCLSPTTRTLHLSSRSIWPSNTSSRSSSRR
jgi:hypothetical protein